MTEQNPLDELRDRPRAPKDVVRSTLSTAMLDALDAAVGGVVTVTEPGELVEDADGLPLSVGPSTSTTAGLGTCVFRAADLAQLGITTDEARRRWPALTFI